MADAPAMKNDAVGKHRPLGLCNELGDVPFYLHRRLLPRQLQALHQATKVRIHGKAGYPEGIAQHHQRRLAAHPRQGGQFLYGLWNLAVEFRDEALADAQEVPRLRPLKPLRPQDRLQIFPPSRRIIGRGGIGAKQLRGYRVHARVRALCGKHRGHQKLEGRIKIELAPRIGVFMRQSFINDGRSLARGRGGRQ